MLFSHYALIGVLAALALQPSVGQAQEVNDTLFLSGFLADMLCTRLEIAPDAANMIIAPETHTVRCELLPACLRSGYGLIQNIGTDGNPLYRVAAVFDEAANDYIVDMFQTLDPMTADLRVQIRGTVIQESTPTETPAIVSSDGERMWPALNDVPTITVDALQFCNYQGPDAVPIPQDVVCTSTSTLLQALASSGDSSVATANLCMDGDIDLTSADDDYYMLTPTGCADHATFQDVKRADLATCSQTTDDTCDDQCTMESSCATECLDGCGNPLQASLCCLDACGNAYYDSTTGSPYLDACGNPTTPDGAACPVGSIGENQVNECLDVCGNPIVDACGNPVDNCCLDPCGNPLLDPCGFPWLDACGNPAMDAAGASCMNLGANVCLPRLDCAGGCDLGCTDACGNPIVLANGQATTSCCLDPCGNPILDPCGFPFFDSCGNPTTATGETCVNVAENQVNQCTDACGNPFSDACGNPIGQCCLDACGNPLLDPCGNPFLDVCGNPVMNAAGDVCTNLGANTCDGGQGGGGGGASWRKLKATKTASPIKGLRRTLIANHEKIVQSKILGQKTNNKDRRLAGHMATPGNNSGGNGACQNDCADACGNPLTVNISGRRATICCLNACGNPIVDACGFPYYDACGNPQDGMSGNACMPMNIGRSLINECVDSCGNPYSDACGNPVSDCCLDGCGNPLIDPCGFPYVDACGNPADAMGMTCMAQNIGENACPTEYQSNCAAGCLDVCGNPLVLASGRTAMSCCLDPCGNPLVDPCGFPYLDACGNPIMEDGSPCPLMNVAMNDVAECVDGCGNPVTDVCGNPVAECCLDVCGNPLLDPCGFPWLDACGNPAMNAAGDVCMNLGATTCIPGQDDTCEPGLMFPPVAGSFQCEGLVSPCTLAMTATASDGTEVDGVPEGTVTERRRAVARSGLRRMQGEPSVPRYMPVQKDLRFKIPRTPTTMRIRQDLNPVHDGVVGVAVNGVPIVFEHPGEGANTMLFDSCGGHGDIANRYHYHLPPVCLLRSLGGTVPRASDWWLAPSTETQWPRRAAERGNVSPLIGWTLDGSPIFGPYNPDNGELVTPLGASGDEECFDNVLDECNGMELENGVYAYFITPTYPFVPPCLKGEVADDAFVDGGALNDQVAACPVDGTKPLSGTEICDEKTIIFQDESCPGNADRQDIRHCFDLATSTFIGEPTCAQMQAAVEESISCFLAPGCCIDLEETLAAWKRLYPALADCSFPQTGCIPFGDDNVVEVSAEFNADVQEMVPDRRASLRQTLATTLDVDTTRVLVESVSGTNATTAVLFKVAYPSRDEAATAAATLDGDVISIALSEEAGSEVNSLALGHPLPPEIPELWETGQRAGLGLSLAAVVVLLAVMVYAEDIAGGSSHTDDNAKDNTEAKDLHDSDEMVKNEMISSDDDQDV